MRLKPTIRHARCVSGLAIATLLALTAGCGDKAPTAQADAGTTAPAAAPAAGTKTAKNAPARRTRGPKIKIYDEPDYNNVVERRQARAKAKQSGTQ